MSSTIIHTPIRRGTLTPLEATVLGAMFETIRLDTPLQEEIFHALGEPPSVIKVCRACLERELRDERGLAPNSRVYGFVAGVQIVEVDPWTVELDMTGFSWLTILQDTVKRHHRIKYIRASRKGVEWRVYADRIDEKRIDPAFHAR